MKKLNNKGLTAIEILVCFSIISVLVISMLNIVNNYKTKQDNESYKSDIYTYKTTLTDAVYKDIIDNKGVVSYTKTEYPEISDDTEAYKVNDFSYTITLTYKSGKQSTIYIKNNNRCVKYKRDGNGKKVIESTNQECTDGISDNIDYENSEYYVTFTKYQSDGTTKIDEDKFPLPNIPNLKYNDINQKYNNLIFNIKIGLWHPDLGTKYDVLNIITPNVNTYPGII